VTPIMNQIQTDCWFQNGVLGHILEFRWIR